MKYVMIVQAKSFNLGDGSFAIEGAFAQHLRSMKRVIQDGFDQIVLVSPQMSQSEYLEQKKSLAIIRSETDDIELIVGENANVSLLQYWLYEVPLLASRLIRRLPARSVVQVDLATDIRRPTTLIAGIISKLMLNKIVFVVDIDFRLHAKRFYKMGLWGKGKYLFNNYVQVPFKSVQVKMASLIYDLCLLKSSALAEKYKNRNDSVHNFFDVAHSGCDVISNNDILQKSEQRRLTTNGLRVCYFGRVVEYKGVKQIIEAVKIARQSADISLSVIGNGPCVDELKNLSIKLGVDAAVKFEPQLNYGPLLFERLSDEDVSVAAPIIEDTPRSAFDAMARGLPIVAFDISYFKDLEAESGAVVTAQWPHPEAIAAELVKLALDRPRLATMAKNAVQFASVNTQEHWLDIRYNLVRRFCL